MNTHRHSIPVSVLFGGLLLVALLFGGLYTTTFRLSPLLGNIEGLTRVSVAGNTVFVHVADTPAARSQGLSGTERLPANQGMLFVFPRDGYYSFWMKDMRYALDILWLSESGIVLHVERNVTPDSYPDTYSSPMPARSVLELPAGFVDEHGVLLGARVTIFG